MLAVIMIEVSSFFLDTGNFTEHFLRAALLHFAQMHYLSHLTQRVIIFTVQRLNEGL